MENEQKKYWFFGSKLNTGLLSVLIILMIVALKWMSKDKDAYLPTLSREEEVTQNVSTALPEYVSTMTVGAGWPPVIQTSQQTYSCIQNISKEGPTTIEKIINGKKYCVSSFIDGGAGGRGGEYTYTRIDGAGTKTANFSLRWVSCGGYGAPGDTQYDQCQLNQDIFFGNLDSLIDSLM